MTLYAIVAALWAIWILYWAIAARFTNATRSSESVASRLIYMIPLYLGMFLIFHDPGRVHLHGRLYRAPAVRVCGVALTFAGLLFAVWARVHLGRFWSGYVTVKEGHELIRTGPYRYVRHPIYSGLLLAVLGSAMTAGTGDAFAGFVIVFLSLAIKIHREEKVLLTTFGDGYRQYRAEVPGLIPFLY